MTIGSSSFTTMGSGRELEVHCIWNQRFPYHAPHPHEPEASDANSLLGRSWGRSRIDTPFHSVTNRCHHARSALNSLLRRIGWGQCGCMGTAWRRLIILRRNERPDHTTLHAWLRSPTRDSRSRREHDFRSLHSRRRDKRRCNLSAGKRSCAALVSISMPRYVRHVVGPSVLWVAIGTPRRAHARLREAIASAHCTKPGGPITIKLSR